ncbi:hypothetical protein [Parasphingopyxis lamellibrachiae]|uniref:Uncharacterized protein n=1 Tax=Parasphingopyxis lamellibrachiae TaxID=680125 RepID=A0A3D9FCY8_9SPHN|nr:hypothetical protein [Parasphingopyxis lamellibrachiae]RED15680.1 hypothetical protein DFR46_0680 [Parasphingopyxis lamellibrachiae]
MGATASNPDIEPFTDYATGKSYLRLHLDVEIPRDKFRDLIDLMDSDNFESAKDFVTRISPESSEYLDLFFGKSLLRKGD